MENKTCRLKIDGDVFEFDVAGDFFWGENKILYERENSVISKTDWEPIGYNCARVFMNDEFKDLKFSILNNIIEALKYHNVDFDEKSFTLSDYHKIVTTDELHYKIIDITRNLTNKDFDFDIDKLTKRFGDILGYKFTSWVEELKKTHVQIRISRPHSLDINPPHRDGYLSYWEDIINIWIPIEGCNEKTSLPVVPASHLIPENNICRTESKGAKINGNIYYVPCILKTKKGILNMVRPNPKQGEALIFTPFLIHGAAVNQSDVTRISLELRFPRVNC